MKKIARYAAIRSTYLHPVRSGLLLILLLATPGIAAALDTLTETELAAVNGRAGITIATGQTFDVAKISFSKMYWDDPDGHPDNLNGGVIIASGSPNQISFGLQLDQGGEMVLDCATTGSTTHTIDGVTIPSRTTFFSVVVDAPVVGGVGRGMKLYLITDDELNLGMSTGFTSTTPYDLGSLSVSNLFFGAVSDPDEPADNDTKIFIWTGPEELY